MDKGTANDPGSGRERVRMRAALDPPPPPRPVVSARPPVDGGGHPAVPDAESPPGQDTLTCGGCAKAFALADIVRFIQHKVLSCAAAPAASAASTTAPGTPCNNNNNNSGAAAKDDYDSDGGSTGGVVSSRRPSISAPITTRKARPPPAASPSAPGGGEASPLPLLPMLSPPPPSSTPKRRGADSDDEESLADAKPPRGLVKLEDAASSPEDAASGVKRCKTDVADAESNTTNSVPAAVRLTVALKYAHGCRPTAEAGIKISPARGAATVGLESERAAGPYLPELRRPQHGGPRCQDQAQRRDLHVARTRPDAPPLPFPSPPPPPFSFFLLLLCCS
ncbi:WAS/WASL-interacting protein family member 3-like [Schistocerca americana]|uniref:WAS/WASL-interacting protein family member 3-like n=1 Tax=Schistocerca americana TaxID=7009 RepID=UPI001F4FF8C9|nr:WAS/WASL-interacting protein family member 3-like [Schistocerca americana]